MRIQLFFYIAIKVRPFRLLKFNAMKIYKNACVLFSVIILGICHVQGQVLEASINGTATEDRFGSSLSISDDGLTLIVGAPTASVGGIPRGKVKIYKKSGNNWIQFGTDLVGVTLYDCFGGSVSVSADGTRAAIGAPEFDINTFTNNGIVRVYDLTGATWTQIGSDIQGVNNEGMGRAVALNGDGTRVVVGGNGGNGTGGVVKVYRDSSGVWVKVGNTITGEASGDSFGSSVAISSSGNRIVGGAPNNSGNGTNAGNVRVFDWIAGSWIQSGSDFDGEAASNNYGRSVSLSNDGNRLLIGGPSNVNSSGINTGHARVFDYIGNSWTQVGADIEGITLNEQFGSRVSIAPTGTRLLIASPSYANFSGRVKIFEFNGTNWAQVGNTLSGSGNMGIGLDQSSNGSRLAIGSPFTSPAGTNSGNVSLYSFPVISSIEYIAGPDLVIFPNPFSIELNIHSDFHSMAQINLYDVMGKKVVSEYLNTNTSLNTSNLKVGVYFYEIKDVKGTVIAGGKLVKGSFD